MKEIGKIVLLQIQTIPIKDVERIYRPRLSLRQVEAFTLTSKGITAIIDGQEVYDVHHAQHPQSRHRQSNPISIGFTSHYAKMQSRFGDHVSLGMAAENVIVESDKIWSDTELENGVVIRSADGGLTELRYLFAMPPCRPFSEFCLQFDGQDQELLKDALQFLNDGTRGFCGEPPDNMAHIIHTGDTLLLKTT